MSASEERTKAQELVLGWFDVDPAWGDQDTNFYASFPSVVEGKNVARPFYLFFGETCLFFDAPFSRVNEIEGVLDKPSAWGIGRAGAAYTYHNVLLYDMILSNPLATHKLIEIFAAEAGRKEFEVSGVISFVVDQEPNGQSESTSMLSPEANGRGESDSMLDGEPLSRASKDCLSGKAMELEAYIQKYGIFRQVEADEVEKFAVKNPNSVFSILPCHAETSCGRAETELRPGFYPDESPLGFYISDVPFDNDDAYPYPYIEIRMTCDSCLEEQNENGVADCDACGREDGNLMYYLAWNESGKVSIERLDSDDF